MLDIVGYVRPLKTIKPEGSAKQSEGNGSSPGNASSTNQPEGPEPYKDAPSGKILEILRVRNRFDMKSGDPHWSGGFRDLAFKVKVGFKVLPVDAVSSSASRTVATLQQPDCRSPRPERRNFCPCKASCLHAAVPVQWLQWLQWLSCHLTPSVLQESLGRPLRQDVRLRAADSPPSK
jgi:hypothetical protein